jgi:hypothetical protein
MMGVEGHVMLFAADPKEKPGAYVLLSPPEGSVPGDRYGFELLLYFYFVEFILKV